MITGSTGFIGSALCRALDNENKMDLTSAEPYTILAFHRPGTSMNVLSGVNATSVVGDLCDADSISRTIITYQPDMIFHLAAQTTAAGDGSRLLDVNVNGTRRLLQSAFQNHVKRVVVISSACSLGIPEYPVSKKAASMMMDESHCWNYAPEKWIYAWSKYLMEREVQLACANGMDVVIVNPTWVIGPGDCYRKRSSFLVHLREHPVRYYLEGGINLIGIDDVIRGIRNAAAYGKKGERYILGGTNISFRDLITILSGINDSVVPVLSLPNLVAEASFRGKECLRNLVSIGEIENNIFRFPGRYFYYDTTKSRLNLHLPVPEKIENSIKAAYTWFYDKKSVVKEQ